VTWQRANLGFVSAYVLARAGEAAIVDTGLPGSEGTIHEALMAAGLDWKDVGHVILTHRHGDHVGSVDAILAAASGATAYAGEDDPSRITSTRPLTSFKDADTVFGLRIVSTPGHTIGHVSVLDEAGGILVAGDALSTRGGEGGDSNPQFTDDMDQALASIRKLGSLTFETLLVGHGDPILEGASARVAAFAAGGRGFCEGHDTRGPHRARSISPRMGSGDPRHRNGRERVHRRGRSARRRGRAALGHVHGRRD